LWAPINETVQPGADYGCIAGEIEVAARGGLAGGVETGEWVVGITVMNGEMDVVVRTGEHVEVSIVVVELLPGDVELLTLAVWGVNYFQRYYL
jgi:hypothetical protein